MNDRNNHPRTLPDIVAELRMGDDGGRPAYRIGRGDKVEISMPSGQPIRSYVIEEVHISELADWIEAAAERERVGNVAAMREALELALDALISWLNGTIDRTTNRETIKAIRAALSAPARNCDLRYYNNATIDVCSARAFADHLWYCEKYGACSNCPMYSENGGSCLAKYLLSPAEGGAA